AEDPRPRDRPEQQLAERRDAARLRDGGARFLDQAPVRHARRADRLARAARQATVEVQHGGVASAQVDPPVRDRTHETQAPARRFRLELRDLVRGTCFETEATVDAPLEAGRVERGGHAGIRPGASTPRGSNRSLSALATPSGTRVAPQAPPASRW